MPDRYKKVELEYRALLWQQFPGATTNQVHRTAKALTELIKAHNDAFAASKETNA